MSRFEKDVFPFIGQLGIRDITPGILLEVLKRIESYGALDRAHRIRHHCSLIFKYAVANGKAERDVAADLTGAMPPVKTGHHAAPTDPAKLAEILRAIDGYNGTFPVICALKLAPMLFVRPGELRAAEWAEIDLERGEWNIPAGRMKMKTEHLVPLPRQAVEILTNLKHYSGGGKYVFPTYREKARCISDNALNAAFRRMGFSNDEICTHGFRASARTIMDEVLGVRPDFIEHQLAHIVRDPNGRAYNRTKYLPQRVEMMQQWADYLDEIKAGKTTT